MTTIGEAVDFGAELARWVSQATNRLGTRKEVVERAQARGAKVSYSTWTKVAGNVESAKPSTLRAIAIGLGLDSEALVAWRDGGPEPPLPERPAADVVEILPGVQREFDDLRQRVDRVEATLLRVLDAVTGRNGVGGGAA